MYDETQQTLGELAATRRGARGVLLRHQLDFCHGAQRTLGDACSAKGLDADNVAAIVRELRQATDSADRADAVDWSQAPIADVIAHIVERYHRPLPAQLRGIVFAAQNVERVHGNNASCPNGLAAHLHEMHVDLASHMVKEERVLFPALVAGRRGSTLSAPITTMMTAHDDHSVTLQRTRALTDNFRLPADACATWRALYEQLEELEADHLEHIHLENHILFPRVLQSDCSQIPPINLGLSHETSV